MSFYEELSRVYDIVFEKNEATSAFLKQELVSNSDILDLGCGTGTYSIELAKAGHKVIGIDLDKDMIQKAKLKDNNNSVEFYCDDMTNFKSITGNKLFDRIFCVGNTLVHLKDREQISKFIKAIYSSLENKGSMIIQIINYDRIIENQLTGLPTIDKSGEGVKFIRNYKFSKDNSVLDFETKLIVNNDGQEKLYENSVQLLALTSGEFVEIIKDAGFSKVELYGGFNGIEYNKASYALVVRCFR